MLSGSVVAVGYVACLISAPGDGAVRPWFLVVVAVGVMVSALRPAAGWFASLTVGGASILIDHLALTSPVSNAAARLGDGGAGLTLALAGLLYLWWRPRAGALG